MSNEYNWTFPADCEVSTAEYEGVRSPVKFLVLDLVDSRTRLTYEQLAEQTGMPTSYAASRLTRYAKRGLLSRSREGDGGLSHFTLTASGRSRLQWFRTQ